MNPIDLTKAYLLALTGSIDTVCDWRVINDREKGEQGRNLRGTLADLLPTLQQYNQAAWGIFICVNAMDGQGQSLPNVAAIRAHFADIDNVAVSAEAYQRAIGSQMPPHMAVQSSEGKYHLYWLMEPYVGNDFFSIQQRKLNQVYEADDIIDATRVLRVPGFYHCKGEPKLVTCWGIHQGPRYTFQQFEQFFQNVNVVTKFNSRHELGDPKLAAPSLDFLWQALMQIDPNQLDRGEWMPISAAFKQAGWTLTTEEHLFEMWNQWCSHYNTGKGNDTAENLKLWKSLKDTQVGWSKFQRITNIDAYILMNQKAPTFEQMAIPPIADSIGGSAPMSDEGEKWDEMMDAPTKAKYFKNCFFVEKLGEIFTPSGRFMNSTQFNGAYGGYQFCVSKSGGKVTDEAWKAALRASDWSIPKVDHIRFLPLEKPFAIVTDRRGRKGVNTYLPVQYDMRPGDVTPFIQHVQKILPVPEDQHIFLSYLAHIIKFPGYKISWAPMLQSTEGAGKTVFFEVLQHALGEMYVYRPKAPELVSSGSKFNAWMRSKLAIVVDEVKTDERRELIEILKPMISDVQVEVQGKGQDQEMEDNPANWVFFTNFKDAIPIHQNGRRFAILYSGLQSVRDKEAAGMGKNSGYFPRLWTWLREEGGLQFVTYWLMNYPIEKGGLPVDAPQTSSYAEALSISRSPLEILIDDKLKAGERGFRNGYISFTALSKVIFTSSLRNKPAEYTVRKILEDKGYFEIGKTPYPIGGEDLTQPSVIYAISEDMRVENYEISQST